MALSGIFRRLRGPSTVEALREKLERFRDLVDKNNQVLELIADAGEKLGGEYIFDRQYLVTLAQDLDTAVESIISDLNAITGGRYAGLHERFSEIRTDIRCTLDSRVYIPKADMVIPLESVDGSIADVTGEKTARLGELRKHLGVTVPLGFVITTHAGQCFLEETGTARLVEEYFEGREEFEPSFLSEKSKEIRSRIKNATLPRNLERAIRKSAEQLKKKLDFPFLAVRSSATDEDGELTFAGQYESVLGVAPERVIEAYKEVLASLYSVDVMNYRKWRGLHPARGGMAVCCMGMVDAVAAGVAYSLSPMRPEANILSIAAARGLGKMVVDGSGASDIYEVSRTSPHPVVSRRIGEKKEAYATRTGKGFVRESLPEALRNDAAVSDGVLRRLAEECLRIERFMKCAQDIEWAVDRKDRLFILQARPLHFSHIHNGSDGSGILQKAVSNRPVLMKGMGEVACRGIASGTVHVLSDKDSPENIPLGAILAARTSTPRLASALARVGAVLTDVGTPTGHLAAIAREYRVPAIMDMQVATKVLKNGMEVTVDAEENVVYEGRVPELLDYQILRSSSYEDKPEFRLLRRILKKAAPLNIKDPTSTSFSVPNCRTYHDIIRFAHEKAVSRLTEGYTVRPSSDRHVYRLDLEIPIDLILIDLGGAVEQHEKGKGLVGLDEVTSAPLLALLSGMTAKGSWITAPADMDLNGFMASATRAFSLTGPAAPRPMQNLAIVSDCYLNLNLKLGYHFNIVDAYISERRNDNYIYFRFAGGVTESARRVRRAVLLKKILEHYDFMVDRKVDLIIARIKKISLEDMSARLSMLGRLIGFTRQLDIFLREDSLVEHYLESFINADDNLEKTIPLKEKGEAMNSSQEVLVLDDEAIVCERLKDYLEKNDYRVEAFTVSQEAIARLTEKNFDVVITDLKMKGPNGLDVLHFVQRQGHGTQVIIITGYATSEAAREAEYTGVFGFINKPFQMEALGAMVKKASKKAQKLKGGPEK